MNKPIIFLLMFALMFTTVSAESIGSFVIDKEMQITNYCNTGTCTYMNLESLEYPNGTIIYPNSSMTQNGQTFNYSFTPPALGTYTFITCGDPNVNVCDQDTFFVNYNGEDPNIGALIILLIFFILVLVAYYKNNSKINYDKWRDSIVKKYIDKNYIKAAYTYIGYSLISNKIGNYYFIVFGIILSLNEIIKTYQINIFLQLMDITLLLYSLGIIMVGFALLGRVQELTYDLIKEIEKEAWGLK